MTVEPFQFAAYSPPLLRAASQSFLPATNSYLISVAYALLLFVVMMRAPLPERRRQLRDIGDTSLYLSGFWSEHLAGGPVDVDYYIGMGGSAYGELARGGTGWTGDPFSDVFSELAANFVRFVGALALVSRRMAVPASNQDVVRLYRLWRETKSQSAAARLANTSQAALQSLYGNVLPLPGGTRWRPWPAFLLAIAVPVALALGWIRFFPDAVPGAH